MINILIGSILIVLVLILVVLSISIFKPSSTSLGSPELQAKINDNKTNGDELQKFASAMLEKLEEEKHLKQEQEMMLYAQSKIKDNPLLPSSTNENQSRMTSVRSKAKELVPFNMSPTERALWEEFNR